MKKQLTEKISNKIEISYFGEIELDGEDTTLCTEILLENRTVILKLEIPANLEDDDRTNEYEKYADRLEDLNVRMKKAIVRNYKEEGTSLEYVDLLCETLDEITYNNLLNNADFLKSEAEKILSLLKVKQISFMLNAESFAVWDYTIGSDITNDILAVYTDKNGKIMNFGMK